MLAKSDNNQDKVADQLTRRYLVIRDAIDQLKQQFEAQKKECVKIKEEIEGDLRKIMEAHGVTSLRCPSGTVSLSTKYTASLPDSAAFMDFVIATQNFDLLDRRANATALVEYVRTHNELPPGAKLSAWENIGVRSPTQKPE